MNYFSKKSLSIISLLSILSSLSYAEEAALEPIIIIVDDTQITIDNGDITSAINQLISLNLSVDKVVTLLTNAGFNAIKITESFVTTYPELVLEILEVAAKTNPNKAADIAAIAARLIPEQAADIAGAAAKHITSKGQAHQIAQKVGQAVNAQKINGEPDIISQAIAKKIILSAPSRLNLSLKNLTHIASFKNTVQPKNSENPSQSIPASPS